MWILGVGISFSREGSMALARQVQAKALYVKLAPTEATRLVGISSAVLCNAPTANDDVVQYIGSERPASTHAPLRDSTSVRIAGNGTAVVARLLALTELQKDMLERRGISVTASEYRAFEGSDALLVFDSERVAVVTLHELGFARVQENGALVPARFYKVVNSSNGAQSMAWARLEQFPGGDSVYVHISLVAPK